MRAGIRRGLAVRTMVPKMLQNPQKGGFVLDSGVFRIRAGRCRRRQGMPSAACRRTHTPYAVSGVRGPRSGGHAPQTGP